MILPLSGLAYPTGVEALMRLLLLARQQVAEPVVAACLRQLHAQVQRGRA